QRQTRQKQRRMPSAGWLSAFLTLMPALLDSLLPIVHHDDRIRCGCSSGKENLHASARSTAVLLFGRGWNDARERSNRVPSVKPRHLKSAFPRQVLDRYF